MQQRSPIAVFFLSLITLGIYAIVWQVKTKNELNKLGSSIPTAWLIIVPFVNIWWLWKYSEGVAKATNNKLTDVIAFILLFLLGIIGMAIIQNEFNRVGATPVATQPIPPTPDTPSDTPNTNPMPPVAPQSPPTA